MTKLEISLLVIAVLSLISGWIIATNNLFGLADRFRAWRKTRNRSGQPTQCDVRPTFEILSHKTKDGRVTLKIGIGLHNTGGETAKSVSAKIQLPNRTTWDAYGLDGNGYDGMKRVPTGGDSKRRLYGGDEQSSIHSGTSRLITAVTRQYDSRNPDINHIDIGFLVSSENCPATESNLRISKSDIYNYLENTGLLEV